MTETLGDLTRRWFAAWTHTKGLKTGHVAGWPLAYVGSASRTTEIVCAEPDRDTWGTLLQQVVGDPTAMLTVMSAEPGAYVAGLPSGVRIDRDDETLMRLILTTGRMPTRATDVSEFDIDRDEDDCRVVLRLVGDGRIAAEGTAGILGQDAVFDAVETTPAFRGRGLAGWVMAELGRAVSERGATEGLLVATAAGAGLYRSLGWAGVTPMRSLTGQFSGSDWTSTNTSFWDGSATMKPAAGPANWMS